ncbi:helix-turn-helix domain-containing protein [Hymenobacter chitinivorans]|uniref:Helix-turn-helix protein n=1 Tax=Hymenobacter chitinivorans DSM 11115 TaxID=1121954 RepID=A0A2M9BQ07_9BACT|nr:helix-turn-helix transcriptional regulator [Hymenobacter chitinivorans]PJJ60046.1 hypothetical protein CLV45_1471 [Hymenobacter chitinivorans DSM 11115]
MPLSSGRGLLRQQLALSQHDLAIYLRVSREQLGQVEIGRRGLPPVAAERMARLRQLLAVPHDSVPAEPPLTPAETDPAHTANIEVVDEMRRRLRIVRHEAGNARYELSLLRDQAPALRRRVAVLRALQATLPAVPPAGQDDPDGLDRLWYEHHIDVAEHKLTKCGRLPQSLLENRIRALDLEIATLESLLPPAPAE